MARFLQTQGFVLARQQGSHQVFIHEDGRRTIVPFHASADLKIGTLKAILEDADLSRALFLSWWSKR
jgi:predicted RNA binding protein YcfA (HicA-like mRNA interferase family)